MQPPRGPLTPAGSGSPRLSLEYWGQAQDHLCGAGETGSETHASSKSCWCEGTRAPHLPPALSPALQDLTPEDSPQPCLYPLPQAPAHAVTTPGKPSSPVPALSRPPARLGSYCQGNWPQVGTEPGPPPPTCPRKGGGDAAPNQPYLDLPAAAQAPSTERPRSAPEGVLRPLQRQLLPPRHPPLAPTPPSPPGCSPPAEKHQAGTGRVQGWQEEAVPPPTRRLWTKGHSAVTGVTPAAPCGHLQGRGSAPREGADSQAGRSLHKQPET